MQSAVDTGRYLAENGITLVYGGGKTGLMGQVADSALEAGGKVVGIIPSFLKQHEVAHPGLTELVVVDTMHQRKRLMLERSDAFVTLPGGIGTLEEFAEVLSWSHLGLHGKPIGLLNIRGFYHPLLAMMTHFRSEGFVGENSLDLVVSAGNTPKLIHRLAEAAMKHRPAGPHFTHEAM